MNDKNNIRIVQKFYEYFRDGDIAGLLDTISEDALWVKPKMESVPLSGMKKGKREVGEFFHLLLDTVTFNKFELKGFYISPEGAAVHGMYNLTVNQTGTSGECDFMHIFTVKDGLITQFREITDTAVIVSIFAPVEEHAA